MQQARMDNFHLDKQLRKLEQVTVPNLQARIKKLEAERDPDSEATKALKKKINKASAVRAKVARALTETTTTTANRLDALQVWNALGLNKIGK